MIPVAQGDVETADLEVFYRKQRIGVRAWGIAIAVAATVWLLAAPGVVTVAFAFGGVAWAAVSWWAAGKWLQPDAREPGA